jgi:hypothetical protein
MPSDRGPLRSIAWQEVFPWLLLFRTIRLAAETRKMFLAALAIMLTAGGWLGLGSLFSGREEDPQLESGISAYGTLPWQGSNSTDPQFLPGLSDLHPGMRGGDWWTSNPLLDPWRQLADPFRRLFDAELTFAGLAFYALCALWALAVWAFFGGAISRIAAVELAREDRPATKTVFAHVRAKFPAYFAAPLMPLVGVLIGIVLLAPIGLLTRFDIMLVGAGLMWPLALIGGLVLTIFLVGLLFGWPLMWGAISAEGMDSWDALSRSYAYVYQRPLHYLFYAGVSSVLGGLGWLFVSGFAALVIYLAAWGVSWTAGGARIDRVEQLNAETPLVAPGLNWPGRAELPGSDGDSDSPGMLVSIGAGLIGFWSLCVRMLALGFAYSFFWTSTTAIYFLLRRDTDGTPLDDVHLEEEADGTPLPALSPDAAGVPLVADEPSGSAGNGADAHGNGAVGSDAGATAQD